MVQDFDMKEEVLTAGTTRAEGRSVDTWPVVQHCDEYSTEVVSVVSNLRYDESGRTR